MRLWMASAVLAGCCALGAQAAAQPVTGRAEPTIVVTARKAAEPLLESPLAVSVVEGAFLGTTGLVEIERVAEFVPGFDITPASTTRATGPKIRGISTFSFSNGFESSVATVVDDVVFAREAQGYFDLYDVEAIEVVKGPQSTLFGKNASAGLIIIRTHNPLFEPSAYARMRVGNYAAVRLEGAVSGPLSSKVAVRLAAIRNRRAGFIDTPLSGEADLNDKDGFGIRAKLLALPSERLTVRAVFDYARENDRCCVPTFRTAGAPTPALTIARNPGTLQLRDALSLLGIQPGPNNRRAALVAQSARNRATTRGASLTLDYELGGLTASAISAWRRFGLKDVNEADGVSTSEISNTLGAHSQAEQVSQEVRIAGAVSSALDLVAGLFYFDQTLTSNGSATVELALPVPPFFNVLTVTRSRVRRRSLAAFAEATVQFMPRTAVVLGARLSADRVYGNLRREAVPIISGLPFGAIFGGDLAGRTSLRKTGFSGRINLRHYLGPNLAAYATLSRGYKGPGIDVSITADARATKVPGGLPVLPSELTMLREAGLKGQFATLSFALVIFDQDLRDLQTIQTDSTGALTNLSIDRIASRGGELDLQLRPFGSDAFVLRGSLAYLDIDIAAFAARPDLEGKPLRDNSRWSWSVAAAYRTGLSARLDVLLQLESVGQSAKLSSTNLEEFSRVPARAIFNLRVGLATKDERLSARLAVENVFDKTYPRFIYGSPYRTLDGATSAQFLGEPRRVTISLFKAF